MSASTSQQVTQTQALDDVAVDDGGDDEESVSSIEAEELWGELLRTATVAPNGNVDPKTSDKGESPKITLSGPPDRRFIIGRAASSDIVINDAHVSSKHCVLFRDEAGGVWVEDHSLSGTFVNTERVERNTRKRLNNGDSLCLLRPSQHHHHSNTLTSASESTSPNKTSTTSSNAPPTTPLGSKRSKSPKLPSTYYEFIFRAHHLKKKPCYGAINDTYEVTDVIGKGSFATVRRGVNKRTGEEVAVKIVEKRDFTFEPERWQDQLKEIEMLKRLQHSGCVRLLDTYSTDNALYIVMEFIKGGELFDRIATKGKLTEQSTQVLINRLLKAVAYLHAQGIVHRDLKPENILLLHREDHCFHIKVADFGVARLVGAGCKTLTGSMCYIAPEVLERRDTVKGQGTYAFSCDLWSVGVIVYVCLFGRLPFRTSIDDDEVVKDLKKSVRAILEFKESEWQSISDQAKDFLKGLFKIDPAERLNAEQALDHPWMRSAPSSVLEEACAALVRVNSEEASPEEDTTGAAGHPSQQGNKRARMAIHPPVPLFSQ